MRDEPNTVATANAVTLTGATPILADVDPQTLMLDPIDFAGAYVAQLQAHLVEKKQHVGPRRQRIIDDASVFLAQEIG